MTAIYDFASDTNRFQAYLHASDHDLDILEMVDGAPVSVHWTPPSLVPDEAGGATGDRPSVLLGSCVPCLSLRAVEVLRVYLEDTGEVLPVDCDHEHLAIFNCTRFADVLDTTASDVKWSEDGSILWARQVAWKQAAYNETFFRIPQMHGSPTFVTEKVRATIEQAQLRGFLFQRLVRFP